MCVCSVLIPYNTCQWTINIHTKFFGVNVIKTSFFIQSHNLQAQAHDVFSKLSVIG